MGAFPDIRGFFVVAIVCCWILPKWIVCISLMIAGHMNDDANMFAIGVGIAISSVVSGLIHTVRVILYVYVGLTGMSSLAIFFFLYAGKLGEGIVILCLYGNDKAWMLGSVFYLIFCLFSLPFIRALRLIPIDCWDDSEQGCISTNSDERRDVSFFEAVVFN